MQLVAPTPFKQAVDKIGAKSPIEEVALYVFRDACDAWKDELPPDAID